MWRRSETFSEYFHEKVILANRVPINDEELVENIIDGISDPALLDQARMHRFTTKEELLAACEKITLRHKSQVTNETKCSMGKLQRNRESKPEDITRHEVKTVRCHNCGIKGHIATNCPSKSKGRKCFECHGFGHVASSCPSRKEKDNCAAADLSSKKCCK